MKKQILDGNAAAAEAIRTSNVEVVAMYPITPQSPLAEKLSLLISKGEMNSTCTCVESEHSAISYVIGAQLTGVRSTTATSSVGLALMHEVLGVAAGCHVPIVMPVVNRALVSPWSLWCDHQDTMCERDTGWMQIYAENAQEIYDLILCAYRVAEHRDVCLPMMVCMDGFYVSHTLQTVITENDDEVSAFVGRYQPTNLVLDNNNPMFINNLTSPDEYTEMRYQQKVSFDNAKEVMKDVFDEFNKKVGREYSLKITALVLLIVKLMMFIAVLLLALTGIVLSIKLLLLWCGGKDIILPIHKALITGTLLLSSLQLGINLANIPLPPLFAKKESIIRYFAIVIMLIGTIVLVFNIVSVLYRKFLLLAVILGTIAAGYLLYKTIDSNCK